MSRLRTMHRRVSVEDGQVLVWIGMVIGFVVGVLACWFSQR